MATRSAPCPRRGAGWPALLALALVSLHAHAEDGNGTPVPRQSRATLAYLAPTPAEAAPVQAWLPAFRTMVAQDFRQAGVFLAERPQGAAQEDEAAWWVRTVARPGLHGKVLVACQGGPRGNPSPRFDQVFVGSRLAWAHLAHRVSDFVVGKITGTAGVANSEIVFSKGTAPGVSEIFGSDRDGRHLRKITAFGSVATHPALAADGRLALVTFKGGPPQIWGQTRTMGPLVKLFPRDGDVGMGISGLSWSPDGSRIAFILEEPAGTAGLQILDPESGRVVRITPRGHRARCPSWNPLGTALAFVSDQGGVPQVFIVGAEGGPCRQVTHDAPAKSCAAWSPAGDQIAYAALAEGRSSLLTVSPEGEKPHPIGTLAGAVASLCWAPDGRWLLLGLKRGDAFQLDLTDLAGISRPVAGGLTGSPFPQWTRNPPHFLFPSQADASAAHPGPAPSGATAHL